MRLGRVCGRHYDLGVIEKLPGALKVLIVAGVLLMGPAVVFSLLLGGVRAGIVAVVAIIVYFTAIYIIGVRRYAGGR
jgi:hypothetical protein